MSRVRAVSSIPCAALALVLAIVLAGAACRDRSTPLPDEEPRAEDIPQTVPAPDNGTTAGQQSDPLTLPQADWSILEKDPLSTRLGRWDEFVEANEVCLGGTDLERCRLMRRTLEKAASLSDVQRVMADVRAALPVLQSAWADEFARAGRTFVKPAAFFYGVDDSSNPIGVFTRGEVARRVGDCMKPFDNALYCDVTNTIYFDAVLLTRIAAAVRDTNGTSGRYAAIAIAGHELGHAWHVQVYGSAPVSDEEAMQEELLADCYSGAGNAVLKRADARVSGAQAAGVPGGEPLTEGQLGLYLAGGPKARGVHAAGPVRADAFTGGFNRGFNSCVERFPLRR
jgi:hypothetical protein